ncbi:MAG: hypothetical protein M3P40_03205 [Actinomycetota bacterium]|nr:hypothetical protein [Actinomycetota bacterium]
MVALLHPEFVEFGASGRKWDADAIAGALAAEERTPTWRLTRWRPCGSARTRSC